MESGVAMGRYTPPYRQTSSGLATPVLQDHSRRLGDMYSNIGDGMLARAEQLASADVLAKSMSNHVTSGMRADLASGMRNDVTSGLFIHPTQHHHHHHHQSDMVNGNHNMAAPRSVSSQMALHGYGGESMLEHLTGAHLPMAGMAPPSEHSSPTGFGLLPSSSSHTGSGLAGHTVGGIGCSDIGHAAHLYHSAAVYSSAHVPTVNHNGMMSSHMTSPTHLHTAVPSAEDCSNHLNINATLNNNNNSVSSPCCSTPASTCATPSTCRQQLTTQATSNLAVSHTPMSPGVTSELTPHPDVLGESDPRELEAFAEHFKQRRIKLGVTQADVGTALGKLKIPGVGSLSQSTICRFESLTLSHNNMIALKPVLQTWLENAEAAARQSKAEAEAYNLSDKKRKRTSIAAPEKRSLEAYFAIQPRPSGEKIAQIAEKLDLKKNVVRVWFCNQRQKQKRMKFSATVQGQHSPIPSH